VRQRHDADEDAPERDRSGEDSDASERVRENEVDRREHRKGRQGPSDQDAPRPQRRGRGILAEEIPPVCADVVADSPGPSDLPRGVPEREVQPDRDQHGHDREERREQQRLAGVDQPRPAVAAGVAEADVRRQPSSVDGGDAGPREVEVAGVRRQRAGFDQPDHQRAERVEGVRPEHDGDQHHGPAADRGREIPLGAGSQVLGTGRGVHHVESAEPALHHRNHEREREPGDGRDHEQPHESRDDREVGRDVPESEVGSSPPEVLEVLVPAVREVQSDHPDEIHHHPRLQGH
jgi:hypothetical protein